MLTSNEIYYLSSAIDNKGVYGIDSMKALARESVSPISAEESLINKKYINKDNSINEMGLVILKRLEDYKNAKTYIWADGKVIAYDDSPYLVTLDCDENRNYKLERTLKAQIVAGIFKDKLFLLGDIEVEEAKKIVNVNRMTSILEHKTEDEVLFLRKEKDGNIDYYNVYFKDDGSVFKYDVLKKTLYLINPKRARNEILDLFKIERGE